MTNVTLSTLFALSLIIPTKSLQNKGSCSVLHEETETQGVQSLTQGHRIGKGWDRDLNPGHPKSKPSVVSHDIVFTAGR